MFEQYEVWFQDGRSRRMWVIYTMAHSFKEARKNTGGRPVDCRRCIERIGPIALDAIKEYLNES